MDLLIVSACDTLNMAQIKWGDRRKMWERDRVRKKMTRGRKVTERPYSACLSLKETRWNIHTGLPSVNRVCKRGRESGEESLDQRRQSSENCLCFVPISFCSSSRSPHIYPVLSVPHNFDSWQGNWINCPHFFSAMRAATASKQKSFPSPLFSPSGPQ